MRIPHARAPRAPQASNRATRISSAVGGGAFAWLALVLLVVQATASVSAGLAPHGTLLAAHGPIAIVNDSGFTPANGVTGGNGTPSDPYVIEGWSIESPSTHGILITDTTRAFVIRNVSVRAPYGYQGIAIWNATDGRVEDSEMLWDLTVEHSARVSVSNVTMWGNHLGVEESTDLQFANMTGIGGVGIIGSRNIVFQDNVVQRYNTGVYFGRHENRRGANYSLLRNRFTPISPWDVYIDGIDGVTIADNEFEQANLDVSGVRSGAIRNNSIRDAPGTALDLAASQDIEVSGNDVFGAQNGAGLFIEFSNNLTIDGNNLTNVSRGLSIWSSTNTTVRANHLFGTGISVHGTDLVHFVTHTFGTDNTVNGLPFVGYRNCSDVTIDGAAVAEVFLSECKRVHIRGLTLDGSEMGIMLAAVDDALVEGNNFSSISSEAAIQVFGGTNVSLRSNYITGSGGGLLVSHARDVSLVGNTMDRNSIGAVVSDTTDGVAYHNNFIHTGPYDHDQARGFASTNFSWDGGYPTGGNYWSDYRDFDRDHDGLGDGNYSLASGGIDSHPLILPWNWTPIAPVARLYAPNPTPFAGQAVALGADESSDLDGSVLGYHWDFGDGTEGYGVYVYHTFAMPGTYTVTLTVTDNSELTNSSTALFTVRLSTEEPIASFDANVPQPLFPGFAAFFNADNSWTKYGTIVSYDWNFGDGSFATGSHASHTFQSPGGYNVVLTVQNTWGLAGTASRVVVVEDIPPIPLVAYSHPSGFRLPVPQAWAWSPDEVDRGLKLDLVLRGPVHDNFRTNIIVQSIHDQSVAEDRASMERLVSSLLEELRSADPGLSVTEPPRYRTVANHAAVEFAIQHSTVSVEQKVAIVVSDLHREAWLLILSVRTSYYPLYNDTFEKMVDGFEITAFPQVYTIGIALGIVVVIAAVVVLLVVRSRRRAASRHVPLPFRVGQVGTLPPPPATAVLKQFCTNCGTPITGARRFCGHCGVAIGGSSVPYDLPDEF